MGVKKCPECEGELVKSKSHSYGHTIYFWQKPWAKFMELRTSYKVFPWACMGCGRVFFYLDDKEFEAVKMEYQKKKVGL